MTAYNRILPKNKKGRGAYENASDESGYASFHGAHSLHNSTVEAPFFLDHDSEAENCRNAPNTTFHFHKDLNSTQFQTPQHHDLWRKSESLQTACSSFNVTLGQASCTFPEIYDSCPSPPANQIHCATKRRKHHFQASHSSPKKSKKQLFLQPERVRRRSRYYNGVEKLDIICMLSNTIPALECILGHVNAHALDAMTQVTMCWEQAVLKSKRAVHRLQNHRNKMNLTKENAFVVKLGNNTNNQTVPLQPSNAMTNRSDKTSLFENPSASVPLMDIDTGYLLVEQAQRIKCPRCGKCSKVYRNEDAKEEQPKAILSQTLPLTRRSNAFGETNAPFKRFYSLDEVQSSPDENINIAEQQPYTFAECTGMFCKFTFCTHCYTKPHPGTKCLVSDLGTPSKIMLPSENVTPPKQKQKPNSKLNRKNSLKRLCF